MSAMIHFGMQPNPALSIGMRLTKSEFAKSRSKSKPVLTKRRYASKGYSVEKLVSGESYRASFSIEGKGYKLGGYKDEAKARAIHVEAVDKYNEGCFFEWHEALLKRLSL